MTSVCYKLELWSPFYSNKNFILMETIFKRFLKFGICEIYLYYSTDHLMHLMEIHCAYLMHIFHRYYQSNTPNICSTLVCIYTYDGM